MNQKRILPVLAAIMIALVVFFIALTLKPISTPPITVDGQGNAPLGADRDVHGCIGSAGYSWCEAKQKCLRAWEEPCEEIPFGQQIGDQANAEWGFKGVIYPATDEAADEGWWRGSFNVPPSAEMSSICYIFSRGNLKRRLDDGTTFIDHGPVETDGKEVCEIVVSGGMAKPCGDLTVHMDLDSMKSEYNKTADNWQDFFSCAPKTNVTFCQNECWAMMDKLMEQERWQINVT